MSAETILAIAAAAPNLSVLNVEQDVTGKDESSKEGIGRGSNNLGEDLLFDAMSSSMNGGGSSAASSLLDSLIGGGGAGQGLFGLLMGSGLGSGGMRRMMAANNPLFRPHVSNWLYRLAKLKCANVLVLLL